MLSHVSGMPDVDDYHWYAPEDDDEALERYVRSLANENLIAAPSEKFAYSNMAFEVLGDAIAKVSGKTFEAYIKEHILNPLKMHDSTFLYREVSPDLAATPHFGTPLTVLAGAYPYHRAHAPSSTLHSSVQELSHWAIANLNRGSFNGKQILQSESYDLLWRSDIQIGDESPAESVGLSWFLKTYRDRRIIHHSGSDSGFGSNIVIMPEEDAAIVVLANSNTAPIASLTNAILDLLLGFEPELPKPSIAIPIAATLAAEGQDAACKHYHHLRSIQPDRYDTGSSDFIDAIWGAIGVRRVDTVMPLLNLWLKLQPDAAEVYELLGWADLVRGDRELAIHNFRQSLTLDPENAEIERQIQLLSDAAASIT